MKIHLLKPEKFTISDFTKDDFDITEESPALNFSALRMWVAALSRCTYAVLEHYGYRFDADPETISMTMSWEFDENPTKFKKIIMDIHWPTLQEKRLKSVQRVAQHCTIHNTIHDCVDIETTVSIER